MHIFAGKSIFATIVVMVFGWASIVTTVIECSYSLFVGLTVGLLSICLLQRDLLFADSLSSGSAAFSFDSSFLNYMFIFLNAHPHSALSIFKNIED
ncbi:hypothetical protein VNO77_06750 [Canavalia gladiata]|uniref:Uncharacterized protein n=1 Tax=Canavalia gladiata TaxID=3824 RepID=A0AAN9MCM5_CANGL